jgi:hypothetical protein
MSPALPLASSAGTLGHRPDARVGGRPAPLATTLLDLVVALLLWQVTLFAAVLWEVVDLRLYAVVHFASLLLLAAGLVLRQGLAPAEGMGSAALQIVAWSALGGPFGTFVAVALALRPVPASVAAMTVDTGAGPSASAGPDRAEHMHLALRDRRIRVEGAHRVRPLMDVMADGSQSERLEALSIVYRKYDADLGPVLAQALRDPSASVRVLAATVISKLNATFSRRIGDRQTTAAATPDAAQSWRKLGEARLAYAESGLLEASLARAEIEAALRDLARAAEIDPAGAEIAGRLHRARQLLDALRM